MRKIIILNLLFFLSLSGFSQYKYNAYKIEPGIYLFPMKSWWDANGPVEIASLGVGISMAYKLSRRDGIESGVLLMYQQGIELNLPCHLAVPPCPPTKTRVPFVKIPFLYRYTYDLNSSVVLKAQIGPQLAIFTGSQPTGKPFRRLVPDAVTSFEVNHKLSEAFYITYGVRFDIALINPENLNATLPNGDRYFEPDRKEGRYYNVGLIVGFHLLWERYKNY